jgi:hypothetical protein
MLGQFNWLHPSTWPWVVYVWAVFALAGTVKPAFLWLRRKQAEEWPIADGRIDNVNVTKPRFSVTVRQGHYLADIAYSYSVEGTSYSAHFRNELPTEREAVEFARDLDGKPILVRYNPDKHSSSTLRISDIEALQATRTPEASLSTAPERDAVPDWLRPFLWLFVGISCIGLALSMWVHVGAIFGQRVVPESFFWMLHVGIFIVWIPAVLIAQRLVGNTSRRDFWKVILKDSPVWLRYMVYGFGAYAIVNFLLFLANTPAHSYGANPPAEVWRGFSGHWMAFYTAAFAILYSAAKSNQSSPVRYRTPPPPHMRGN